MQRFSFLLFAVLLFAYSCKKKDEKPEVKEIAISSLSFSACTSSLKSTYVDTSCITIKSIKNNNLSFTHKGAGFCCASEGIDISLNVKGDSIIIQEVDKGPFSYCYCKHDISFNLGPLDYGNYKVKIVESMHSYSKDTFVFELNHNEGTNLTDCITHYTQIINE